jgi:hypothetical protein
MSIFWIGLILRITVFSLFMILAIGEQSFGFMFYLSIVGLVWCGYLIAHEMYK